MRKDRYLFVLIKKKKADRNIYLGLNEEYHQEVVGKSPGQPGNRVLEAMNGVTPRLSRIHPMTDFVNMMLNKNPFIFKLEHEIKQKNTNGANFGNEKL